MGSEMCIRDRDYAGRAEHVLEIAKRPLQSTVAFLAAQPKRLTSIYRVGFDYESLHQIKGRTDWTVHFGDPLEMEPVECDLLFIDDRHTAEALMHQLLRFGPKVRKWIILHDTELYGERGEDGSAGLRVAMRGWLRRNPQWSVVKHFREQYGLTILSCLKEDKPKLPSLATQAVNFAKAVARHVRSGAHLVDKATLEERLQHCALCEHRVDNRCAICGCFLVDSPTGTGGKAEWASQSCPLGKWLALEPEKQGAQR